MSCHACCDSELRGTTSLRSQRDETHLQLLTPQCIQRPDHPEQFVVLHLAACNCAGLVVGVVRTCSTRKCLGKVWSLEGTLWVRRSRCCQVSHLGWLQLASSTCVKVHPASTACSCFGLVLTLTRLSAEWYRQRTHYISVKYEWMLALAVFMPALLMQRGRPRHTM